MKILVGIKRVVDYNVRVRVKPDGSGVALDGVKMSINPFDEIALEEALRIRERGQASEVLAVAIGPDDVQTQLRSALAMGADRAILVKCDAAVEPRDVARTLLAVIRQEGIGLAILGKQAIDDDAGQTGQMLAALWERPQVSFASKVEIKDSTVSRQLATKSLEVATSRAVPDWLSLNKEAFRGVVMRIPSRDEIQPIANEQAVVEFYSR